MALFMLKFKIKIILAYMAFSKVSATLLFILFLKSINLTAQKEDSDLGIKKTNNQIQSVSKIEGQYRIDTTIILTNQNLQSLLKDIDQSTLIERLDVNDIPRFITSFLEELNDEKFTIANRGEMWQETEVVDEDEVLPVHQLIYFGISKDLALMAYYTGGVAKSEHILIFKFQKKYIIDFWCGEIILKEAKNKEEILKYLKDNKEKKWGLNTNMIFL